MKLSELPVGGAARVAAVGGAGALRKRLLEMGFTPGTRVAVRGAAPLGDPLEILVRGYALSLRAEDAARIDIVPEVETCPAPSR